MRGVWGVETFQPFIMANKPVFHIEYLPSEAKFIQNQLCGIDDASLDGLSIVLKNMDLEDTVTKGLNA